MTWVCIPFTYSQEREAESSETCSSDIRPLPLAKSKNFLDGCCYSGSLTEFYHYFPFGTILGHCDRTTPTAQRHLLHGVMSHRSSSSAAGFRARTSVAQVREPESRGSEADSGLRWPALSARFDRATSSWKIHPCLFPEDSILSSPTLPKWGTMRFGVLSAQSMPAHLIGGCGYGSWPTPDAGVTTRTNRSLSEGAAVRPALALLAQQWPTPKGRDYRSAEGPAGSERDSPDLNVIAVNFLGGPQDQETSTDGVGSSRSRRVLNPRFCEMLMGWPDGWTDSRPLGMDRFRRWLRLHGGCWERNDEG